MKVWTRASAIVVVLALAMAACGNSKSQTGSGSSGSTSGNGRPGVTDTEIKVGGVASVTNPLGGSYADAFDGAQAYFDKINSEGGVFNRKINLVARRDDNAQASRNKDQTRALVEQDNVFAVVPVSTITFAGAKYLVDNNVPAFGWNINPEWALGKNLFGEKGSNICFDCPNVWSSYLAKQLGLTNTGIMTYTAVQSQDCAKGWESSFNDIGKQNANINLAFEDKSLGFGFKPGDISGDLDQMKSKNVQLLATCVDGAGSARLGQAFKDNNMNVVQLLPNGYDKKLLSDNAATLEGDYVTVSFFPFEADQKPQALQDFLDAMKAKGKDPNENSLSGWINAMQFVQGVKDAGPDFTRQSVIDAINKETNFTAGGIRPQGINWTTTGHVGQDSEDCVVILKVQNGALVPVYGQPGKPMVCFDKNNIDLNNPTYK
jgi:ABC-type branched-subunit amino acid transport system substrate-binding protein